jgi:hypothetical protein
LTVGPVSDRTFLDANVIFSAAYRTTTSLRRLWNLPGVWLLTSQVAVVEVQRNLPATQLAELQHLLQGITLVPTPERSMPLPAGLVLPAKDIPIFQAAATAEATHLLTGDRRHFGDYYGQRFEGVLILTPGSYLQARNARKS